ncbi:unnamed protein product [Closterium sp. NIES-64]|nr:unnamed protein product [Closterium sp. NIES-64]
MACYAGIATAGYPTRGAAEACVQPHVSGALETKLRQYHRYRRECLRQEPMPQLRATLLAGNRTACRYLLYHQTIDGQGNRLMSLVSSFAYALLTDRILLLLSRSGPATEFCEPFEHEASWVLFDGPEEEGEEYARVLRSRVAKEWRSAREGEEAWASGDKLPPPMLRLDINQATTPSGFLFFCEAEQQWLSHTPTLLLTSNQYFLPALYLLPSFRRLLLLFPAHMPFRSLSRLLLFPRNRIWAGITHRYHTLIAPAPARVGLQGRFSTHAKASTVAWYTDAMGRCMLQALNSSTVQRARGMRLAREAALKGNQGPFEMHWGRDMREGEGGAEGVGSAGRGTSGSTGHGVGGVAEKGALRGGGFNPMARTASDGDRSSGGGSGSGDCSVGGSWGNVTEVMVASLNQNLVHNLSGVVMADVPVARVTVGSDAACAPMEDAPTQEKPPPSGTASTADPAAPAATVTPADDKENTTNTASVDRAIIDIYTLALFSDALIISKTSTFGYLCASLFGVPHVTFVGHTCIPAVSEPCMHWPPTNDRCPDGNPQKLQVLLAEKPDVPLMPLRTRAQTVAERTGARARDTGSNRHGQHRHGQHRHGQHRHGQQQAQAAQARAAQARAAQARAAQARAATGTGSTGTGSTGTGSTGTGSTGTGSNRHGQHRHGQQQARAAQARAAQARAATGTGSTGTGNTGTGSTDTGSTGTGSNRHGQHRHGQHRHGQHRHGQQQARAAQARAAQARAAQARAATGTGSTGTGSTGTGSTGMGSTGTGSNRHGQHRHGQQQARAAQARAAQARAAQGSLLNRRRLLRKCVAVDCGDEAEDLQSSLCCAGVGGASWTMTGVVGPAAADDVSAAVDVVSAAADVVSAAADVVSAAADVVSAAVDVVSASAVC